MHCGICVLNEDLSCLDQDVWLLSWFQFWRYFPLFVFTFNTKVNTLFSPLETFDFGLFLNSSWIFNTSTHHQNKTIQTVFQILKKSWKQNKSNYWGLACYVTFDVYLFGYLYDFSFSVCLCVHTHLYYIVVTGLVSIHQLAGERKLNNTH